MNQFNFGSTKNYFTDSSNKRIVFIFQKYVKILNGNSKEPLVVENQIKLRKSSSRKGNTMILVEDSGASR
jgi:hypothetical protein